MSLVGWYFFVAGGVGEVAEGEEDGEGVWVGLLEVLFGYFGHLSVGGQGDAAGAAYGASCFGIFQEGLAAVGELHLVVEPFPFSDYRLAGHVVLLGAGAKGVFLEGLSDIFVGGHELCCAIGIVDVVLGLGEHFQLVGRGAILAFAQGAFAY